MADLFFGAAVPDLWQPERKVLTLQLLLPPTDNNCHRSGAYSRYATAPYRDWLKLSAPKLKGLLGDWEPDTETWWGVWGALFLPSVKTDTQNYLKPVVDLLSGAYVVEADVKENGKTMLHKDRIVKPGGLWNDDRRVKIRGWEPVALRHPEPCVMLRVVAVTAPVDWKAREAERARREREAAKAAKAAAKPRKGAA